VYALVEKETVVPN